MEMVFQVVDGDFYRFITCWVFFCSLSGCQLPLHLPPLKSTSPYLSTVCSTSCPFSFYCLANLSLLLFLTPLPPPHLRRLNHCSFCLVSLKIPFFSLSLWDASRHFCCCRTHPFSWHKKARQHLMGALASPHSNRL